jgi:hypothetical protein
MEKYVFKEYSIKRRYEPLHDSQMSGIEVLLIGGKIIRLQKPPSPAATFIQKFSLTI